MLAELKDAVVRRPPGSSRCEFYNKFREYRQAVEKNPTPTNCELANIYSHLYRGNVLVSINKAMQIARVRPNGEPVLAIANAAARWVWFVPNAGKITDHDGRWRHSAVAFVSDYSVNPGWNRVSAERATKANVFRFSAEWFPVLPRRNIRARVPLIPPRHMPKHSLSNYHILWEADWQAAPRDPLLLRRISREYFVVMAEWDLTDVERHVLEMASFAAE